MARILVETRVGHPELGYSSSSCSIQMPAQNLDYKFSQKLSNSSFTNHQPELQSHKINYTYKQIYNYLFLPLYNDAVSALKYEMDAARDTYGRRVW